MNDPLPPCNERKELLTGGHHDYACSLLRWTPAFGILLYRIDRHYDVHGLLLRPGDITYALYWSDRPYTLYLWYRGRERLAAYFNIADGVVLHPEEFRWRDLAVDIFVDTKGTATVLDEDELPAGLPPALLQYIHDATTLILRDRTAIIQEAIAAVREFL